MAVFELFDRERLQGAPRLIVRVPDALDAGQQLGQPTEAVVNPHSEQSTRLVDVVDVTRGGVGDLDLNVLTSECVLDDPELRVEHRVH